MATLEDQVVSSSSGPRIERRALRSATDLTSYDPTQEFVTIKLPEPLKALKAGVPFTVDTGRTVGGQKWQIPCCFFAGAAGWKKTKSSTARSEFTQILWHSQLSSLTKTVSGTSSTFALANPHLWTKAKQYQAVGKRKANKG